jgi:hypothetical protein
VSKGKEKFVFHSFFTPTHKQTRTSNNKHCEFYFDLYINCALKKETRKSWWRIIASIVAWRQVTFYDWKVKVNVGI